MLETVVLILLNMKKTLFVTIFALVTGLIFPFSFATPIMANGDMTTKIIFAAKESNAAEKETAKGEELWNKLESKEIACQDISDNDFEAIGEYLMERMMGSSHETMDVMMTKMMGEQNSGQIHAVMAKRMTGCDPQAELSGQQMGFMTTMMPMMMQMMGQNDGGMMSGASTANASWWNGMGTMMGTGFGSFMWLGAIFSILFWILIIVATVALIKWIFGLGKNKESNTSLNILKERYAKGEIGKEEFEQKTKELKNI